MRAQIRRHEGKIFLLLILLILWGRTPAEAAKLGQGAQWKGDYAITLSETCATDSTGFGADLTHTAGGPSTTTAIQGVLHQDTSGSGTFDGRQLTSFPGNLAAATLSAEERSLSCTLSSTANADGTLTIQFHCMATNAAAGLLDETTDFKLVGQNAVNKLTLIFANTTADVETLTFSDSSTQKRICNRSGTGVRIQHSEGFDGSGD